MNVTSTNYTKVSSVSTAVQEEGVLQCFSAATTTAAATLSSNNAVAGTNGVINHAGSSQSPSYRTYTYYSPSSLPIRNHFLAATGQQQLIHSPTEQLTAQSTTSQQQHSCSNFIANKVAATLLQLQEQPVLHSTVTPSTVPTVVGGGNIKLQHSPASNGSSSHHSLSPVVGTTQLTDNNNDTPQYNTATTTSLLIDPPPLIHQITPHSSYIPSAHHHSTHFMFQTPFIHHPAATGPFHHATNCWTPSTSWPYLPHAFHGATAAATSYQANSCHVCGKTYARLSTLRSHLKSHSGEKPYQCSICQKSFTQAANLTAHLRTHSGEKPFKCPVCHRGFSQSSSVTTHMRTHSGDRPYKCNVCNKGFADSSTLTKHYRTHTGEKPYQCKICDARFSQSGNLNRHMRTHRNHYGLEGVATINPVPHL